MKRIFWSFIVIGGFVLGYFLWKKVKSGNELQVYLKENKFQNGDLIFHTSKSSQSLAIQKATKSEYSHCGIVYKIKNEFFVFEAVQPVSITPIEKWVKRGLGNNFVIKRLKNHDKILTTKNLERIKFEAKKFLGKNYDLTFEWSDQKMYCSELIWKVYKNALNIDLGKLQVLKDFDLSHPKVQGKLKERYGNAIPFDEKVISPQAIFESDYLFQVN